MSADENWIEQEFARARARAENPKSTRLIVTKPPQSTVLRGRCIGCFHDFAEGPCGGCGALPGLADR